MPRRRRTELAGGIHHVTGKTPSGRLLFLDDRDRQDYLQLVAREVRDRRWGVLTFCLMPNHVHLLVQTPEPDLGAGMKRIHETFAQSLNQRHELQGHVFGARFYGGLVRSDRHVVGCMRYIARNPVRAQMCRRARDWPWSAHRALAGLADAPPFLDVAGAYEHLGRNAEQARVNYLRMVAQSDATLLADLVTHGSDAWLITAVDSYSIPVLQIADFLGVGVSTAYRRLSAARENEGSGP